jgi:three-Cys-motif partner protein
MSVSSSFFDRRSEGSEVKSRIVVKHFDAWAHVMAHSVRGADDRLAYIDLYAGPGRYNEGAASTPLLVLAKAIGRPYLHNRLVTIFNDADAVHHRRLEREIAGLPGIEKLRHKPVVLNLEVGPDLTRHFGETRLVPTFSFVDPCGYKGLSLDIIRHLIKDWGSDCLFFFNYRRINAAFDNDLFSEHVDGLFGAARAANIRQRLSRLRPRQREEFIHSNLESALQECGGKFVMPFAFKNLSGTRITHSLIFVTKDPKGSEIIKEIMAPESSIVNQGVPSFVYSPSDRRLPQLPLDRPLDALQDMLIVEFAGSTIRMADLHRIHHVRGRFTKKNYRDALLALEGAGRIDTRPTKRPANTFGERVMINFPAMVT